MDYFIGLIDYSILWISDCRLLGKLIVPPVYFRQNECFTDIVKTEN